MMDTLKKIGKWILGIGAILLAGFWLLNSFFNLRSADNQKMNRKIKRMDSEKKAAVEEAEVHNKKAETHTAKAKAAKKKAEDSIQKLEESGHGTASDIANRWNSRLSDRMRESSSG